MIIAAIKVFFFHTDINHLLMVLFISVNSKGKCMCMYEERSTPAHRFQSRGHTMERCDHCVQMTRRLSVVTLTGNGNCFTVISWQSVCASYFISIEFTVGPLNSFRCLDPS